MAFRWHADDGPLIVVFGSSHYLVKDHILRIVHSFNLKVKIFEKKKKKYDLQWELQLTMNPQQHNHRLKTDISLIVL